MKAGQIKYRNTSLIRMSHASSVRSFDTSLSYSGQLAKTVEGIATEHVTQSMPRDNRHVSAARQPTRPSHLRVLADVLRKWSTDAP